MVYVRDRRWSCWYVPKLTRRVLWRDRTMFEDINNSIWAWYVGWVWQLRSGGENEIHGFHTTCLRYALMRMKWCSFETNLPCHSAIIVKQVALAVVWPLITDEATVWMFVLWLCSYKDRNLGQFCKCANKSNCQREHQNAVILGTI